MDAGCGTGKYTIEFFEMGAKVIGIDFSKGMLKKAKEKNCSVNFIMADMDSKLPFKNNSFHKITCAQTVKHLKNMKFTFREFFRILKNGGFFIFSVTHPEMSWKGYKLKKDVTVDLEKKTFIHKYKFSDYFSAFYYSGFKIDEIKQLKVSEKIKSLLKPESYKKVKNRYQIVIFRLKKD